MIIFILHINNFHLNLSKKMNISEKKKFLGPLVFSSEKKACPESKDSIYFRQIFQTEMASLKALFVCSTLSDKM